MSRLKALKIFFVHLVTQNPKRHMGFFGIVLILLASAGITVTDYMVDDIRQSIVTEGEAALQSISVYLAGEFNELERTGDVLAGLPWASAALESKNAADIMQANENLSLFNKEMEMSVCYIMDSSGTVVASSNYRESNSFVGGNYGFRKYFSQASRGIASKDFALGITSLQKGIYAGSPVRDIYNRVIGVAVVKQDPTQMDAFLQKHPQCFFVNRLGIILLSSQPEYTLKSLWPLDKNVEQDLIASRQFGSKPFQPILKKEVVKGMEVNFNGVRYLANREFIGQDGWSIVFLTKMDKVAAYRLSGLIITAVLICLLVLAYLAILTWVAMPEHIARLTDRDNILKML